MCLLGSVVPWSVGVHIPYYHDFSSFISFVLFLRLAFMYLMLASNVCIDEDDLER